MPIKLSDFLELIGVAPELRFREADVALPNGLYRFIVSGDAVILQKNTAASGDFSTFTEINRFPLTTSIGGMPVTQGVGDVANEGASGSLARADHRHGIPTGMPSTQSFGDSPAQGTSTAFARADHKHGMPANPLVGTYGLRGFRCERSRIDGTLLDMAADVVVLRNASNQIVVRHGPTGTVSNRISLAGPVAGGRDQAAAFAASSWVHFYFIWDGTTLASVSSASPPPTGPTLPSGYTHWAYATSVFLDSAGTLLRVIGSGDFMAYDTSSPLVQPLHRGTATAYTAVDLSAVMPPISRQVLLGVVLEFSHSATDLVFAKLRPVGAVADENWQIAALHLHRGGQDSASISVMWMATKDPDPQRIEYKMSGVGDGAGVKGLTLWVRGYRVPNGS
jgi:hypothetical protein